MSMPTYSLNCEKCNFVVASSRLWGEYLYQDDTGQYLCHTQLGWCADCSDMVPIEDFGYHLWELEAIESRCEWLASELSSGWQALLNFLSKGRRARQSELLHEIQMNTATLRNAFRRKGTERCLECGSSDVKAFDGDVNITLSDDSVFEGSNKTGFIHPGCGGELVARGSGARFNIARETRIYTPHGDFVESF